MNYDLVFWKQKNEKSNDDMNTFVDIGIKFDCPLYDPQTDERAV